MVIVGEPISGHCGDVIDILAEDRIFGTFR
jgi:hypothetical protein